MLRHLLGLVLFIVALSCDMHSAAAVPYEVSGIKVSVTTTNAVQARDQAILKAQRIGLASLTGTTQVRLASIGDVQIARLMRGFSVQGERVTGRTYAANFTIRFNPGSTQNFAASNGLSIIPSAQQGTITASAANVEMTPAAKAEEGAAGDVTQATAQETVDVPTAPSPIVVLPVLDIGPRRTLWDEPNPWRDTWQQGQNNAGETPIIIPQGDISDVTDVPDAGFLTGSEANFQNLLTRYQAGKLYVVVAKNQSDGMALSLYAYDGQSLTLAKKTVIHPRPGFLFNDAVPAAIRLINGQQQPGTTTTVGPDITQAQTVTTTTTTATTGTPVGSSVTVTVPYQSLAQWVGIQKRLRQVAGVRSVAPIGLSPSSARVKISMNAANFEELQTNMAQQNFDLQRLPDGELALTEK